MNTASTVSVALCTCNGEAFLSEQLESIRSQTAPPSELVVSDDASTDRTVEILNSFKESSPFPVTIIVNKSRLGVCKNFENAIRHCSGEIIFLADQDDIWLPAKIATIMTVFENHPVCGYVFSNADLIDQEGSSLDRDLWITIGFDKKQQARYAGSEQLNIMLRQFALVYGMTLAFRASFKPKLMPFECSFSRALVHDGWISLLLTSIGAYGVAVPSSLVKYRQHETQFASAGRPLSLVDLAMKRRSSTKTLDLEIADSLIHVATRLQQLEPKSESVERARWELAEKSRHVRARVHANSSHGVERLKSVCMEALSGRYGRYSRSFNSIVKDLVG